MSAFQECLDDWRAVVQYVGAYMREKEVGLFHVCREAQLNMDVCTTSLFSPTTLDNLSTADVPPNWVSNTCRRMLDMDPADPQAPLAELSLVLAKFLLEGPPPPRVFDWDSMQPVDVLLQDIQTEVDANELCRAVSVWASMPVTLDTIGFMIDSRDPHEARTRAALDALPIVAKLREKGVTISVTVVEELGQAASSASEAAQECVPVAENAQSH
jgi:hypothetical protein